MGIINYYLFVFLKPKKTNVKPTNSTLIESGSLPILSISQFKSFSLEDVEVVGV